MLLNRAQKVQLCATLFFPYARVTTNHKRHFARELSHARKVFVEATLKDPASGNKLLAEGEGLFYMRKPPSLQPQTSQPSLSPSPSPSLRHARSSVRTAATATSASLADPGSRATGGQGRSQAAKRERHPPTVSTTSAVTAPTPPRATARDVLSYDEAKREFGPGNPNAAVNIVAFYGGDVTALRQRARL